MSPDNGISRRRALTRLGRSALGLAFMNSSQSAESGSQRSQIQWPDFAQRRRSPREKRKHYRRRSHVGLAAAGTELCSPAYFEFLRRSRRAWREWKPLSWIQHRDPRPMFGICRACRTIRPLQCVHAFRTVRDFAGSGGWGALRALSPVHGGNLACRRN